LPVIRSAAPFAAALLLGACSEHSEAPGAAATATAASTPAVPLPTSIPAGMRGRWGMVPADCEPDRADAKGLMLVDATMLKFYESRGTLGPVTAGDATHLHATFAMTGEGMTWNREQTFVLDPANDVIVRQEFGNDAIPGKLTYHRCPHVIDPDHREPPRKP
jgi:hypothetical protein